MSYMPSLLSHHSEGGHPSLSFCMCYAITRRLMGHVFEILVPSGMQVHVEDTEPLLHKNWDCQWF